MAAGKAECAVWRYAARSGLGIAVWTVAYLVAIADVPSGRARFAMIAMSLGFTYTIWVLAGVIAANRQLLRLYGHAPTLATARKLRAQRPPHESAPDSADRPRPLP